MLRINDLKKVYSKGKKQVTAVSDINLDVSNGEIVCILGHNGAGKTTLIKCVSGLILPTEGEILIENQNIANKPSIPKKRIGAVLEGARNIYYYLSSEANLEYFGLLNNLTTEEISERKEKYLKLFDLYDKRSHRVKTFSRGMQQKVAIMVALMKNPDILMLDEPTLGLDIISSRIVIDIIKKLAEEEKKIIMVTTHDVNLIEALNSRVIFMNKGRIVKDCNYSDLKSTFEKNDAYEILINKENFNANRDILTDGYEIVQNEGEFITISAQSKTWIAENISKVEISNIEKKQPSFEEIYKKIIVEGSCV